MTLPIHLKQLLEHIGEDPFDKAGQRDHYHRPIVDGRGYQRPSTMAKALDDQTNLKDFFAREAVVGVSRNPDWFLPRIQRLDNERDSDSWKRDFRELVEELHDTANANDRRDLGSIIHALTEYMDGKPLPEDPHVQQLIGQTLGDEGIAACLQAYKAEMERLGFERPLEYVEVCMFIPKYNQAGTTDRIIRLPDGRHRILDIKCGQASNLQYSWLSFMVQLNAYANADCIYVPETGEKIELPDRFDKSAGYIAHVDPDTGTCDVYEIDLRFTSLAVDLAQQVEQVRSEARQYVTKVVDPMPDPRVSDPVKNVRGLIAVLDCVEGGTEWLMPRWVEAGLPKPVDLTDAQAGAAMRLLSEAMQMLGGDGVTAEEYERRRAALPSDLADGIDAEGRGLWNVDFHESPNEARWAYSHMLDVYEQRWEERKQALFDHGLATAGEDVDWTKSKARAAIARKVGEEKLLEVLPPRDDMPDDEWALVLEKERSKLVRETALPGAKKVPASVVKDAARLAVRWAEGVKVPTSAAKVYEDHDVCVLIIGMPTAEREIQ